MSPTPLRDADFKNSSGKWKNYCTAVVCAAIIIISVLLAVGMITGICLGIPGLACEVTIGIFFSFVGLTFLPFFVAAILFLFKFLHKKYQAHKSCRVKQVSQNGSIYLSTPQEEKVNPLTLNTSPSKKAERNRVLGKSRFSPSLPDISESHQSWSRLPVSELPLFELPETELLEELPEEEPPVTELPLFELPETELLDELPEEEPPVTELPEEELPVTESPERNASVEYHISDCLASDGSISSWVPLLDSTRNHSAENINGSLLPTKEMMKPRGSDHSLLSIQSDNGDSVFEENV
jgi:hypothetical protein